MRNHELGKSRHIGKVRHGVVLESKSYITAILENDLEDYKSVKKNWPAKKLKY